MLVVFFDSYEEILLVFLPLFMSILRFGAFLIFAVISQRWRPISQLDSMQWYFVVLPFQKVLACGSVFNFQLYLGKHRLYPSVPQTMSLSFSKTPRDRIRLISNNGSLCFMPRLLGLKFTASIEIQISRKRIEWINVFKNYVNIGKVC